MERLELETGGFGDPRDEKSSLTYNSLRPLGPVGALVPIPNLRFHCWLCVDMGFQLMALGGDGGRGLYTLGIRGCT